MGKFVLKDATIIVDGDDLSTRASSVSLEMPDDEVDVSSFQGGDFKEFLKGLSDATFTVNFFNDFEAGKVDDVLWPLKIADTSFVIEVRPFAGARSATNPAYLMTAKLFNYSPLAGSVGEASTTEVSFRNADQAGVTKHTT